MTRTGITMLAAALLFGCGGGGGEDAPAAARPAAKRPALCSGALHARVTGHVEAAAATELSGLVLSRTRRDVLWTHNDSGDRARVFAVTPGGRVVADLPVPGAEAVDWEDIAARGATLYLADIGDNDEVRRGVTVYRVPEPRAGATQTAPAERVDLRYPDGAHDAEALLVDPRSGALVIVTKDFGGDSRVYVGDGPGTLRLAAKLSLGLGEAVTAGDVSADGRTVALRTYDAVFVWSRRAGESVARTLRRRPCVARVDLSGEGQGEALALTPDGRAFLTVPEGRNPAIRRYARGTPGAGA